MCRKGKYVGKFKKMQSADAIVVDTVKQQLSADWYTFSNFYKSN